MESMNGFEALRSELELTSRVLCSFGSNQLLVAESLAEVSSGTLLLQLDRSSSRTRVLRTKPARWVDVVKFVAAPGSGGEGSDSWMTRQEQERAFLESTIVNDGGHTRERWLVGGLECVVEMEN